MLFASVCNNLLGFARGDYGVGIPANTGAPCPPIRTIQTIHMPPQKTGRYDNLQEDAVVNNADPNIIPIVPIVKSSPHTAHHCNQRRSMEWMAGVKRVRL